MPLTLEFLVCTGTEHAKLAQHELGTWARECDSCLEYLNACRLLVEVNFVKNEKGDGYKLDKDHNVQSGSAHAGHYVKFVTRLHEISTEEFFVWTKKFEGIAATFSMMYHTKAVKERVPRLNQAEQAQAFSQAVKEQVKEQRTKKEKKSASEYMMAVEALARVGVPLTVAKVSVRVEFDKQGKFYDAEEART